MFMGIIRKMVKKNLRVLSHHNCKNDLMKQEQNHSAKMFNKSGKIVDMVPDM
jgi:hypothetical protein